MSASNPALSGAPGPGGTCRVCGSTLDAASQRCRHCGAAYGEQNRCPHCHAVADVEPSGALRYRCRVCGGPRVPLDAENVVRSGREIPVLERAQRARTRANAWRIGSAVVGAFGIVSLLVAVLVLFAVSPGALATSGLLVAVGAPFLLALWAWTMGTRAARDRDAAIDEAWGIVAADATRDLGADIQALDLARMLRTDEARAEHLLARLSAEDLVHARVTEAGELMFAPGRASARVRVEGAVADDDEAGPATGIESDEPAAHARKER